MTVEELAQLANTAISAFMAFINAVDRYASEREYERQPLIEEKE